MSQTQNYLLKKDLTIFALGSIQPKKTRTSATSAIFVNDWFTGLNQSNQLYQFKVSVLKSIMYGLDNY